MRHQSTPTIPLTEEQRLEELKMRAWGHGVKCLLRDPQDIPQIADHNIEGHRGRRTKAIRMLKEAGIISYLKEKKSKYSSEHSYQVHGIDTTKNLGTLPTFKQTWQELHEPIFDSYRRSTTDSSRSSLDGQEDFDLIGYRSIDNLTNAEALYVYWHQDAYESMKMEDECYIYPRALLDARIKMMLRAIVEQHCQDDYTTKIERYLGLEKGTLERDDYISLYPRAFSAEAASFTEGSFFGTRGYQEEYQHYIQYYQAMLKLLHELHTLAESKGGFGVIVREMRIDTIQQLLISSPKVLAYEQDTDPEYQAADNKTSDLQDLVHKRYHDKYLCMFLLRHSPQFDYDTLYGDDPSLTKLPEKYTSYHSAWEPSEHTVKVLQLAEKGLCHAADRGAVARAA